MRVNRAEIEFASKQKDDGANGGDVAVAASLELDGLEQAVDGFEEAIGLAGSSSQPWGPTSGEHVLAWTSQRLPLRPPTNLPA